MTQKRGGGAGRGHQRAKSPPPELQPFIESLAELLVADHLRREVESVESLKLRRQRAARKTRRLPH